MGERIVAPEPPRAALDAATLIAAVSVLLARYSDRTDFGVGYVHDEGGELRTVQLTVEGGATLSELVARVNGALAAPELDDQDGSALDVVVAVDREPSEGTHNPPWLVAHRDPEELRLVPGRDGFGAMKGLADELVLGHLRTLLCAAVTEPEEAVGSLDLRTDAERRRQREWNETARAYPRACLPELISEQARRTPEAIAVSFRDDELTYAELDERANRLAHHLVTLGVGPEILVGICVERSLEMVVGALAILKARGAYVPIDPGYPAERQEYMLTSSQAPVVLTQAKLRASLPVGDATVVLLDADVPGGAPVTAGPPSAPGDPAQLAYVIYTSGSTGKPKGVQIGHQALVNFLTTMQDTPGLGADDVLVAVTTLSFDIAGLELYLPLITGARVAIAPAETASDPRALASLLERSGATVLQATPTTWRMLVDSGWRPAAPVKGLCGGEALPAALADEVVGLGVELWNMYGPTETTIWSTCSRVSAGEPITIGRPIANTSLYVLDAARNPVPVGVAGELWIGGDGVARGYRGRPDLTQERFLADPFAAGPGARMYRTGDLARYRADGNLEYLGRIDHQVKVRGFRIELGEIETVLAGHVAVAGAVVVARGSGGDAELAAYVILRGVPISPNALRQFLGHKLPAYMVPSTVTALESFPLTPNGKIDRQALPEPSRERSAELELVAPRTPLEHKLAEIWERELGISPIGVTDNFFDLGVTSIVAASLFAAIEHALGDDLPLGGIFRAPTIEALARLLESGESKSRWTSLVPIQGAGSQPPMFCVHGGGGTILHLAPLARALGDDQPFYGLQSRGLYGGVVPPSSVEDMATHYLSEMRQVHPGGPWRLAGYCFGALVAFEMAHRLVAEGENVEMLAIFNGPSPTWIREFDRRRASRRPVMQARAPAARQQRVSRLLARIARALREPRRLRSSLVWYSWHVGGQRRARIALRLGQPIPEPVREEYFLLLHQRAERAYEPRLYGGELLVFRGQGLYDDDPELGWGGLASGGIRAFAVPGEHDNNRQMMMDPYTAFVSDRLSEYLAKAAAP